MFVIILRINWKCEGIDLAETAMMLQKLIQKTLSSNPCWDSETVFVFFLGASRKSSR